MISNKLKKKVVRSRAPLRLGLIGGGTDLSPFCDDFGGAVINSTINKYAYVTIKDRDDDFILFSAEDLSKSEKIPLNNFSVTNCELQLHAQSYKYIMELFNNGEYLPINIISYCEMPPGSGLGSSSTIVVTIIKAFVEYLDLGLDDYQVAQLAFNIERIKCKISGGKQDQFAAAFGGFNLLEFYSNNRTIVTPLKIKNWILCELEASILLYFTGVSRYSSDIISDQIDSYKAHSENVIESMQIIKKDTYIFKELLMKGDFKKMSSSIKKSWIHKKQTSKKISNANIDKIYESAMKAGAKAGKVSGAGGGGFIWFLVNPEKKMNVINCLNEFGGFVTNCAFTNKGCEAWTI